MRSTALDRPWLWSPPLWAAWSLASSPTSSSPGQSGGTQHRVSDVSWTEVNRFLFLFLLYFYILLQLPPLRFQCVGGCWDRNQDCYRSYTPCPVRWLFGNFILSWMENKDLKLVQVFILVKNRPYWTYYKRTPSFQQMNTNFWSIIQPFNMGYYVWD